MTKEGVGLLPSEVRRTLNRLGRLPEQVLDSDSGRPRNHSWERQQRL